MPPFRRTRATALPSDESGRTDLVARIRAVLFERVPDAGTSIHGALWSFYHQNPHLMPSSASRAPAVAADLTCEIVAEQIAGLIAGEVSGEV